MIRHTFACFTLALGLGLGAFLSARAADSATLDSVWEDLSVRRGSVTLLTENDKYFAGTDRHYTNGFKLLWLGETSLHQSHAFLQAVAKYIPTLRGIEARQRYKVGVALTQEIFTPTNTDTTALQPNDRPYAGWLHASLIAQAQDKDGSVLRMVELSLGVVGPSALGEAAQNGWHDVINAPHALGWANQLHDEPAIMLSWERRYRLYTLRLETHPVFDLIGRARITLGNVHTHIAPGLRARLGWNLPPDFGADLIRPCGGSMANARARAGFSAHLFLSAEGRAVARNIFLDGNTWRSSHSVDKLPTMADLSAGLVVSFPRFQLTYTQDYRTREYRTQAQRDVFGSIAVTMFY